MPIRHTRNTITSGNDWPHSAPARLPRNTQTPRCNRGNQAPRRRASHPAGRPNSHHRRNDAKNESPGCGVATSGWYGRGWVLNPVQAGQAIDPTGFGETTMPTATGSSPSGRFDVEISSAAACAADSRVSHLAASLAGSPLYLTVTMNTLKQAPSSARRSLARFIVHAHMTCRRTLSSLHDATLWRTQTAFASSGPRSGSSASRSRSSGRSSNSSRNLARAAARSPLAAAPHTGSPQGDRAPRVLVVDDEESITQLVATVLRYEGFEVE